MSGQKLCFLPLGSHGHGVLLVVDRRSAPTTIRSPHGTVGQSLVREYHLIRNLKPGPVSLNL